MGWTDKIKGAISQVKDSGASVAIRKWLTRELVDYGEVVDFTINSRERSAELHILLKGEREKITVWIDGYELAGDETDTSIVVTRARGSREWITAVLQKFVVGKQHRIPQQYSGMVKLVLQG